MPTQQRIRMSNSRDICSDHRLDNDRRQAVRLMKIDVVVLIPQD